MKKLLIITLIIGIVIIGLALYLAINGNIQ